MGHIQHHAIIVTSCDATQMQRAAAEADRIGLVRTPIVESPVNGHATFCVVPDGSKSGWADSDKGDAKRAQFKGWLAVPSEMGRGIIEWAEVVYSADDRWAEVTDSPWEQEMRIERGARA